MAASKKLATRPAKRPGRGPTSKPTLDRLAPLRVNVLRRGEVQQYLTKHADLASPLEGLCSELREAFGPDAELSLEMYQDPEVREKYLTLYVRQSKYGSDIMDRIEAVAGRFMSQLESASGHLLITTDFRRPRG